MNFVLAALIFVLLFSFIGETVDYQAVIGEVQPGSPAAAAGLEPGDQILSIDGETLASWQDLSRILGEKAGRGELEIVMQRGDREMITQITPRYDQEAGRVLIGVVVDANRTIVEKVNPFRAVYLGLRQTFMMIGAMVGAIVQMATGQISVSENLSGPVALVQIIGETAASGLVNTLFLTAFLSVNLGIMNLLPIPALDGGKVVVYLIELLRRKPMRLEVEGWINMVGFALLISLMLLLTFKDIFRVFGGS
jgi:regulator of sigma E protease